MAVLLTPELWVLVGFVILIAAIARPVGRMLGAALDSRAERIRSTLDEAEKLREEAQHLLADYQRKHRNVAKEAEAMLAQARTESERLARDSAAKLETMLARREQAALEKIAQAEAAALAEVRATTVDVAIAATRELLKSRLDRAKTQALVDSAIAELPRKLH